MSIDLTETDLAHLRRCVELAARALEHGDDPFGSVLADRDGVALAEAVNREGTDRDPTAHPELELAHWAIANLSVVQRAQATVYTSGEHCPMCAGAHGWAGLGRVVAAVSAAELAGWRASWGLPASPVAVLAFTDVVPGADVVTSVPEFTEPMRELHDRARQRGAAERGR